MHIYIYMYMHIYICACTHIYICTYIYTYMCNDDYEIKRMNSKASREWNMGGF